MTTEYNQRERAKSLAMLEAKGKHVLQNKFTPTPSHMTDISLTFKCAADELMPRAPTESAVVFRAFPRRCHK